MADEYPGLNDYAISWSDAKCKASVYGGQLLESIDVKSLNWKDDVEVGVQLGPGGVPKKRTTGQLKSEATATLYASGHRKLLRGLIELAPRKGNQALVSLVVFDWFIEYTLIGDPNEEIFFEKILGCRLLGRDAQAGEGTDPNVRTINLNPMKCVEVIDGIDVVLL